MCRLKQPLGVANKSFNDAQIRDFDKNNNNHWIAMENGQFKVVGSMTSEGYRKQ